jgi:glycosyltransferase involved in cell wall biosynthesis
MAESLGTGRAVCLVVPGPLDTLTGGYVYDRRILQELKRLGWRTSTLALDASFPVPTEAAIRDASARFDQVPDGVVVVIDGLALSGLLPVLPAIAGRLETVALIHHPLADETGIDEALAERFEAAEKSALEQMTRVIVTSPWTRRRLADFGIEPERIHVIVPGVDRYPVSSQATLTDEFRLLTVATLTPRKGHAILVEALARLKSLDWSLRLAGGVDHDPEHARSIRAQIEREGLTDRVVWLGELSPASVSAEYARASLFVLPSYLEGYGMALAEAIAHGLPVVSTTAGAIPDTVPATASRLVPPGDVDALANALAELIRDEKARRALERGARAAAAAVPTWVQSAEKFGDVLSHEARR